VTSLPRFHILALAFAIADPAWAQTPKELWARQYDGLDHRYDKALKVAVDDSGNVIVTGPRSSIPFGILRSTPLANGALLWEQRHLSGVYEDAIGLVVDRAGHVILTGLKESQDIKLYTAKYDGADGTLLWKKAFKRRDSFYDAPRSVTVDNGGNVIVSGYTQPDVDDSQVDGYLAKYAASDGAVLWKQRGPAYSQFYKAVVDGRDDIIVSGYAPGRAHGQYSLDYYTAKYAASDGALIWEHRYDGPVGDNDEAYGVSVDSAGNVAVTGYSTYYFASPDYLLRDIYTAKYAGPDGLLLWEKRYHGPGQYYFSGNEVFHAPTDSVGTAVAMDSANNVIVSGSVDGNFFTAKYAGGSGAVLWKKRRRSLDSSSVPTGMALDSADNVIVTG
jgi:hypothetical protein